MGRCTPATLRYLIRVTSLRKPSFLKMDLREMKLPTPETREYGFPHIIDTDGVEVQRAMIAYAKALEKEVSVLSEAEKREAWMSHILEKYGGG